jgi:hypothetical protein
MSLKTTIELTALTLEIDYDQTAIGLPSVRSSVFLTANLFWQNEGVSGSVTPWEIQREWFVLIFFIIYLSIVNLLRGTLLYLKNNKIVGSTVGNRTAI